MSTNRRRITRKGKGRIAANITKEYLEALRCRDFLGDCGRDDIYDCALSDEEAALLREYEKCDRDFEKWQKMKKGA